MTSERPAVLGGTPVFPSLMRFVRPWVPSDAAMADLLGEIRLTRWLTNQGPQARAFEKELASFLGVDQCATVCNGTLGLMLALRALGVSRKVVVPAFTFAATGHAVTWGGCSPVFVDVEPEHWTIDPGEVERILCVEGDVEAVVGVHLFGNLCDHESLAKLATSQDLRLIYDAAHVFGTTVESTGDARGAWGRDIAAWGDASVFSFHATKPFHTGEGGVVASNGAEVVAKTATLRNFGFVRGADCDSAGINAKMGEMPAGLGRLLLAEFPRHIQRRNQVIGIYRDGLQGTAGLHLHQLRPGVGHNGSYFPLRVLLDEAGLDRDGLFWALMAENIETRPYFDPPLHRMQAYAENQVASLPIAEALSREVLCLPLYSDMRDDEATRIVEAIRRIMSAAPRVRGATRSKSRLPRDRGTM